MRKTSKTLVASTLIVGVSAITWLYVVATSKQRELGRFLRQLSTVELGKTTPEQCKEELTRAKISNVQILSNDHVSGFGLRADNEYVHKLHLAPLTVIDASVGFHDGVANEIYVILAVQGIDDRGRTFDVKGLVIRETSEKSESCDQHYTSQVGRRESPGDRSWGTIVMNRCVSAAERTKALSLNAGCLTKIGGCETIDQMNPKVFGGS
jgi:hypothetical protein